MLSDGYEFPAGKARSEQSFFKSTGCPFKVWISSKSVQFRTPLVKIETESDPTWINFRKILKNPQVAYLQSEFGSDRFRTFLVKLNLISVRPGENSDCKQATRQLWKIKLDWSVFSDLKFLVRLESGPPQQEKSQTDSLGEKKHRVLDSPFHYLICQSNWPYFCNSWRHSAFDLLYSAFSITYSWRHTAACTGSGWILVRREGFPAQNRRPGKHYAKPRISSFRP